MRKFHFTLFFMVLLIFVVGVSVSLADNHKLAENKAMTSRFYEKVLNKHNPNAMEEFVATNFVDHNPNPGQGPGLEGLKQQFVMFFTAFPDMHITVEDQIAEGDKVVSRLSVRATHKGDFMHIPATGKQITITGIDIVHIKDGKAVERWGNFDDLGMMQQLGVMPAPEQAGTSTEQNKALVRRWFEMANSHDFSNVYEVCASDYVHHDPSLPVPEADLETWKQIIEGGFIKAFPDLQVSVQDMVAEGDKVVTRWRFSGTHNGEMPGEPPLPTTGKQIDVSAVAIHRIAGGKIAETWVNFDAMGMMQQLGVIPAPEQAEK